MNSHTTIFMAGHNAYSTTRSPERCGNGWSQWAHDNGYCCCGWKYRPLVSEQVAVKVRDWQHRVRFGDFPLPPLAPRTESWKIMMERIMANELRLP